MSYTNSPLVSYTKISPNQSGARKYPISRISIHCVVGQCTVEALGAVFAPSSRCASSNYGIGYDGKVGMYVEEKDRSWCTSSGDNDNRAITIEVASDTTHPYAVRQAAYDTLLNLAEDICRRNGKNKVLWWPDKEKALSYTPAANEIVLTVHRWFANKSCPGDYLYNRHAQIAAEVNKRLAGGGGDAEVDAAIDKLAKLGVINSPAYWKQHHGDTKHVGTLLKKAAAAITATGPRTATVEEGVKALTEAGIIDSPDYWKTKTGNVGELLKALGGAAKAAPYETYTVKIGDTLWGIAFKKLGAGNRWTEIRDLNGLKSAVITVGQTLKLPK